MTLRDNKTGKTTTLLAKTCTNTGAWVHVRSSLAGGHSFTLKLVSHDDAYPTDPTYVQYDDVTLT